MLACTIKVELGIEIAFSSILKSTYTKIRWKVDEYCHPNIKKLENSICDLDIKYRNGPSCKKIEKVS